MTHTLCLLTAAVPDNYFKGLPDFIWEGIFTLLTTLAAGILVAYFTSTFLKRKEERTRLAGIIVEKRIAAEQEILRFLEKELFKEELNRDNTSLHDNEIEELLEKFNIPIPYPGAPQYARVFLTHEAFEAFFHRFEEVISSHKLWLDVRVRKHLIYMQMYFSGINIIPLHVKRIPLPEDKLLTDAEFKVVCDRITHLYGIVLDYEINELVSKLDELIVDSIYKLDLDRPRKSILRNGMLNADIKYILKKIRKETLLGALQQDFFALILTVVYIVKGFDPNQLSEEEFARMFKAWDPDGFNELEQARKAEAEAAPKQKAL